MKNEHLAAILMVAVSFAASFWAYPFMSERVASHWNAQGEVDGYMDRGTGLYLMPIISLALLALFIVLPKIDPLGKNYAKFQKEYDGMIAVIIGFMLYIQLLTIGFNLGYSFNMTQLLVPAFAGLFYYLGLLMEKVEPNWFVGIRTPWTLSSPVVWKKTHRIAGRLFRAAAIASLIGLAFPSLGLIIAVSLVLAAAVFSMVYSYLEYQKEKKAKK